MFLGTPTASNNPASESSIYLQLVPEICHQTQNRENDGTLKDSLSEKQRSSFTLASVPKIDNSSEEMVVLDLTKDEEISNPSTIN